MISIITKFCGYVLYSFAKNLYLIHFFVFNLFYTFSPTAVAIRRMQLRYLPQALTALPKVVAVLTAVIAALAVQAAPLQGPTALIQTTLTLWDPKILPE